MLLPRRALYSSRPVNLLPLLVDPGVLGFDKELEGGKLVEIEELGERREFYETEYLARWEELTEMQATVREDDDFGTEFSWQ